MSKEDHKEQEEKEESKGEKTARVLRDAYERLSASGTPELDYELKEMVNEAEKAAGIEYIETKPEPPVPQDKQWQGEPVPPFRQGDVTRFKEHPIQKTPAQIREENKYKQEHRGEISQQKTDEATGRDHRGQTKAEAEKSDKSKDEQAKQVPKHSGR